MAQTLNAEVSLNSTTDSCQNGQIDSPYRLKKLYNTLLNTEVVQTGLEKFNKVSGPVVVRLKDTRAVVATKVADTVLSTNIYNRLADLFLLQSLPYGSLSADQQEFVHAFEALNENNKTIYRDLPLQFYQIASSEWRALESPSYDEIRDAVLRTVARLLNKNLNLSDESLSQTLFNIFRNSLEKLLPSQSKFASSVVLALSEAAKAKGDDTLREAAKEYYTFARRFTYVDYPLRNSTGGWTGLAKRLLKTRASYLSESSLTFFEDKLDFVMNSTHVVYGGPKCANNLVERTERILRKLFVLALHPVKVTCEKTLTKKEHKLYVTADKYLHLTERLDNALYYSLWGYDVLKDRVVVPTYDYLNIKVVKTKTTVSYLVSNINTEALKRNLNKLVAKYTELRKTTIYFYNRAVRIVFNKAHAKEVHDKIHAQLQALLNELRILDVQKTKQTALEFYKNILAKFNAGVKKTSTKVANKALDVVPTAIVSVAVDVVEKKDELVAQAHEKVAEVQEKITQFEEKVVEKVAEVVAEVQKQAEIIQEERREEAREEPVVENHVVVEETHAEEIKEVKVEEPTTTVEETVEITETTEEVKESKKSKKNKKKNKEVNEEENEKVEA